MYSNFIFGSYQNLLLNQESRIKNQSFIINIAHIESRENTKLDNAVRIEVQLYKNKISNICLTIYMYINNNTDF